MYARKSASAILQSVLTRHAFKVPDLMAGELFARARQAWRRIPLASINRVSAPNLEPSRALILYIAGVSG